MRILTPTIIANNESQPSTAGALLRIHDQDATSGESLLIVSSDDSDYYFKVASNGRVHFRGNATDGDGQIKVHLQHSGFTGAASSLIWDSSGGVNQMSIRQSEEDSDLFVYAHAQSLNLAEFARTTADVTFNAQVTVNGQGSDILDLYDNAATPVNVFKVQNDGIVKINDHLRINEDLFVGGLNTTPTAQIDVYSPTVNASNDLLILRSSESPYYMKVRDNGVIWLRGNSTTGAGSTQLVLQHSGNTNSLAYNRFVWDNSAGSNQFALGQYSNNGDLKIHNISQGVDSMVFSRTTGDVTLNGDFQLGSYGSGTITGTAAYTLAVDSSGNVIEITPTDGNTTYDLSSAQNGTDVDITLTGSDATTDTVTLVAGDAITLTDDGSNNVTIATDGTSETTRIPVKNTSGSTITKGTPVYITGNVGSSDRLQIAAADASDSAKMPAVGLLETDLINNAEGYVVQGGYLRNLTTATIDGTSTSSNDTVYVKAGGGLTMTKPTGSTNYIQNIAKVARVGTASEGSLIVSSILRTNDIPNLADGQVWVGSTTYPVGTDFNLQEVTDGGNTTTNSIGIGVLSPSAFLEIANPTYSDATVLLGRQAGYPTIQGNGTSGGQWLMLDSNGGYLALNNHVTDNVVLAWGGGDVAIGNGSPAARLHIKGSGNTSATTALLVENSSGTDTFKILNDGQAQLGNYGSGTFTGTVSKVLAVESNGNIIETTLSDLSGVDGSGTANYLSKWSDSDTLTDSVIYDNGTNIGIGTSTPSNTLEVAGPDSSTGTIKWQNAGSRKPGYLYSDSAGVAIYDTTLSTAGIYLAGNNRIDFRVNGSERMRITSAGDIGIGTSTVTNSTGYVRVSMDDTSGSILEHKVNGTVSSRLITSAGLAELETIANIPLSLGTNNTEALRIDTSQNIGIGITTPSEKLHVNGRVLVDSEFILGRNTSTDATNKAFRFGVTHYTNAEEPFVPVMGTSTSTANFANIGGGTSLGNAATQISFYTAANNTTTSGTERMRITNTGAVGIGTSIPSAKTHIVGSGNTSSTTSLLVENSDGTDLFKLSDNGTLQYNTNTVFYYANSDLHLYLRNAGGTNNSLLFWQDSAGGNDWYLGQTSENSHINVYNYWSALTHMQLNITGYTAFGDDVKVGSISSPSAKLHIVGSGNTSGTNALLVENSDGTDLMQITDGGNAIMNVNYLQLDEFAAGRYLKITPAITGVNHKIESNSSADIEIHSSNGQTFTLKGDGQLLLNTYTSTTHDGTPTSFLGVDASGNVVKTTSAGVLTPTLQEVTDAGNTTTNDIVLGNANYFRSYTTANANVRMLGINSGNTAYVGPIDAGPTGTILNASSTSTFLAAYTSGTERMRITSTGNVGINTTSPSYRLSVSGDIGTTNGNSIYIGGAIGDTVIGRLGNTSGVLNLEGDATRSIRLGSATNGEVVRVDNTNLRVGIGTTSPSAKTHIVGSGNTTSTTSLLVESNNGTDRLRVTDGSEVFVNASTLHYGADVASTTLGYKEFLTDVDYGTLSTGAISVYTSESTRDTIMCDYKIYDGTNIRVGTVTATTDGTSVDYTDIMKAEVGDTSDMYFYAQLSGGNLQLIFFRGSAGYDAKYIIKNF